MTVKSREDSFNQAAQELVQYTNANELESIIEAIKTELSYGNGRANKTAHDIAVNIISDRLNKIDALHQAIKALYQDAKDARTELAKS